MPERKSKFIIVYSTFPDLKTAKRIVRSMVREKLCACGNIFRLASVYTWKGKIEESPEYAALIKTRREKYHQVQQYILKHHPYEVPEIVSWSIDRGSPAYLNWVAASVTKRR